MSNRVRNILFITFFIYCIATQSTINGYREINDDLQLKYLNLLHLCNNSDSLDLEHDYRNDDEL